MCRLYRSRFAAGQLQFSPGIFKVRCGCMCVCSECMRCTGTSARSCAFVGVCVYVCVCVCVCVYACLLSVQLFEIYHGEKWDKEDDALLKGGTQVIKTPDLGFVGSCVVLCFAVVLCCIVFGCVVVWRCVVLCSVVLLCGDVLCCVVLCCVVLCCAVLCCTVLLCVLVCGVVVLCYCVEMCCVLCCVVLCVGVWIVVVLCCVVIYEVQRESGPSGVSRFPCCSHKCVVDEPGPCTIHRLPRYVLDVFGVDIRHRQPNHSLRCDWKH